MLTGATTLDLGLCCDRSAILDPAELAQRIADGFAALGAAPLRPAGTSGGGEHPAG